MTVKLSVTRFFLRAVSLSLSLSLWSLFLLSALSILPSEALCIYLHIFLSPYKSISLSLSHFLSPLLILSSEHAFRYIVISLSLSLYLSIYLLISLSLTHSLSPYKSLSNSLSISLTFSLSPSLILTEDQDLFLYQCSLIISFIYLSLTKALSPLFFSFFLLFI